MSPIQLLTITLLSGPFCLFYNKMIFNEKTVLSGVWFIQVILYAIKIKNIETYLNNQKSYFKGL